MLVYTPVGQVAGTALVGLVVVLVIAAATGRLPIRALLAWRERVGKEHRHQHPASEGNFIHSREISLQPQAE